MLVGMRIWASTLIVASWLALTDCGGANTQSTLPRQEVAGGATDADRLSKDEAAPAEKLGSGAQASDEPATRQEPPDDGDECRQSSGGLVLSVDRKTVSLEEGRLRPKMDGPICSLVMRILRKDGSVVEKKFRYESSDQELRWTPVPRDEIEKIEGRIAGNDNAYQAVALVPWSVRIDHQEVRFDTNKSEIRASEVPSLEDSMTKIKEVLAKVEGKGLGTITLFIAGHTDTRGSDEHNLALSRGRAQAIAAWFQKRGLCIPIAFDGFGESALRKVTADEVDEPVNRRVDYILAVEPPVIRNGLSPAWKLMSKGC